MRVEWQLVSKRFTVFAVTAVALGLASPQALARAAGGFDVEIHHPAPDLIVPNAQRSIPVEGRASILGGIRKLDLFLVMDTSKSLRKSDPNDHRSTGAIGLVKSLYWSNAHIGVVDFDRNAELASPLTGDRSAVMAAIRRLDQDGSTDLAAGIRTALEGFERAGRPDALQVMLVFTDGKSKQKAARKAMANAKAQGVLVSTLMLGSSSQGESILREIADGTGGMFVAVTDPTEIPDAFLDLRTIGVERVELRVNDSEPIVAELSGGTFSANVPLVLGENSIVATATSVDGRESHATVAVTLREPGCAELQVLAERDGRPALSISDRAVEIVVDGSGSMWGAMGNRTKIEVAREILDDALDWLPPDLNLSLRAYGHQHHRSSRNCEDTQLLVAPGSGNREEIRSAIRGLQPRGQTPLGYALSQIAEDFAGFAGERAVVLVTDGIESCGGDAVSAARALQQAGPVPVHVIGFGLGGKSEDDLASLRAIASASGGKFLTAGTAVELRRALGTTVGTPYRLWRGDVPVAHGSIGAEDRIPLPAGNYRLELESTPPQELPVVLKGEEQLTLVLTREGNGIAHAASRAAAEYTTCREDQSHALVQTPEGNDSPGVEAETAPAAPAPSADPPPSADR
jgi:Mg-chelatase subunit ChlD